MKDTASYRLLRTIGGITRFARITISSTPMKPPDVWEGWLHAARRGTSDAARAVLTSSEWWIRSFEGSNVDTSDEDAWVAGAMATFDALEVTAKLVHENGWSIVLDSGARVQRSRI